MIDEQDITGRRWDFRNSTGHVYARGIGLTPGGGVEGYASDNEYGWRVEQNRLCLLKRNGEVSCRMAIAPGPSGELRFEGPLAGLPDANFRHILEQSATDTPLRLQTAKITRADLIGRTWSFERADGSVLCPLMQFGSDGEIINHACECERSWSIRDGVLRFHHENGVTTTRFNLCLKAGEQYLLSGVAGEDLDGQPIHRLKSEPLYRPDRQPPLHIEVSMCRPTRPLLVTLNNRGSLFNGEITRFDFYHLPQTLGLDVVRVAEREGSVAWYTDKTRRVREAVASTLKYGHQHVIFIGASAGGYASMLLAELLAAEHPNTHFSTVSINPQTGVAPLHREALMQAGLALYTPLLLEPLTEPQLDCEETEIAELVRKSKHARNNLDHYLLYDSGNPAEIYFAGLVEGLPNFELLPMPLNMMHAPGVYQIAGSGAPQRLVSFLAEGDPKAWRSRKYGARGAVFGDGVVDAVGIEPTTPAV